MNIDFGMAFNALTGNPPFPWQQALYYDWFAAGKFPPSCNLPTGLGKTSVIAIWLIALANHGGKLPRRLVYVVNRRTVVDQTTDEVEKYAAPLAHNDPPLHPVLFDLSERLRSMAADPKSDPLVISTLRGQFADNREWSADPSRPAIIAGTVDMIGSRLLFSGYGVGFKGKPLHAGFLGQDVLLVHDEAHLEPAFQKLIEAIRDEQKREPAPLGEQVRLNVMELTATSRGQGDQFRLTPEDYEHTTVIRRIHARKGITFHRIADEKKRTADTVAGLALKRGEENEGAAILVFLQFLEDVQTVQKKLQAAKHDVQVLTGTLRGLERDRLATRDDIFARFLPESNRSPGVTPRPGTVILICTSAGEVGVNISADHLVCDLTPLDSMAQRFGRVNRFGGDDKQAFIDLVHPTDFETKDKPRELARERSLTLLRQLPPCDWDATRHEGSPNALSVLRERNDLPFPFEAAFAPQPIILPVSDILFDAWALTTLRSKLPGRPMVEPYLHGVSEWEPPQTTVAWREEVWELRRKFVDDRERKQFQKYAAELLEDYPLKAHETLADRSDRVFNTLKKLAAAPETPVWVADDEDAVLVTTLGEVIDGDREALNYMTVLLPPEAGGLEKGLLDATSKHVSARTDYDVADEWTDKDGPLRLRKWNDDAKPSKMKLVREIVFGNSEDDDAEPTKTWYWFVRPAGTYADAKGTKKYELQPHLDDAKAAAEKFVSKLALDTGLCQAVIHAAQFHDLGKDRKRWQQGIGNAAYPTQKWAKSGHRRATTERSSYRHEFGSLLDVTAQADFAKLTPDLQELVLHLIAAHHGRARPHFPPEEDFDDNHRYDKALSLAAEVPRRFARLQRKYGRWGLAYLESLVRAADILASRKAEESDS